MNMQDAAQMFKMSIDAGWIYDKLAALWLKGSLVSNKFLEKMCETGHKIFWMKHCSGL